MRIFLIRHGESKANADWGENRRRADIAIELTDKGHEQAHEAGKILSEILRETVVRFSPPSKILPDKTFADFPRIRLWHSPYKRARQTAENIQKTCVLDDINELWKDESVARVDPATNNLESRSVGELIWRRKNLEEPRHIRSNPKPGDSWFIDTYEHHLLHEQYFGLWDGLSDEERKEQFPKEWALYKKYHGEGAKVWAPIPGGERRMDVARRVHQAFGTFHRDAEKHGIENIVVVAHGTTNRAFTYSWLHKPWEWFEKERNPKNCSIRLLEDGQDKGYVFKGFDGGQHAGQ